MKKIDVLELRRVEAGAGQAPEPAAPTATVPNDFTFFKDDGIFGFTYKTLEVLFGFTKNNVPFLKSLKFGTPGEGDFIRFRPVSFFTSIIKWFFS